VYQFGVNSLMYRDARSTKHQGIHKSRGKGKGKVIPLQALKGPEGSGRLRLLDFKTIGT
jgi:hypothetical protein